MGTGQDTTQRNAKVLLAGSRVELLSAQEGPHPARVRRPVPTMRREQAVVRSSHGQRPGPYVNRSRRGTAASTKHVRYSSSACRLSGTGQRRAIPVSCGEMYSNAGWSAGTCPRSAPDGLLHGVGLGFGSATAWCRGGPHRGAQVPDERMKINTYIRDIDRS